MVDECGGEGLRFELRMLDIRHGRISREKGQAYGDLPLGK